MKLSCCNVPCTDSDRLVDNGVCGGRGRGCHSFSPVLEGDGTKIAPPGDVFDQPPGRMS